MNVIIFSIGVIAGIALCVALLVMEVLFIKNKHKTPLEALRGRVEGKRAGVIIDNPTAEGESIEEWVEKVKDDGDIGERGFDEFTL